MTGERAFFQVLRLASPGLPVGGYAYSQGLESALDAGLVRDAAAGGAWIAAVLAGPVGRHDAPLAGSAWAAADDPERLVAISDRLLASRETSAQQQELLQMGYSLRVLLESLPEGRATRWPEGPHGIAYPVAWALAARAFGLDRQATVAAYLWTWLENQVLVLMKAMPLGHTAGQRLVSDLLPVLEEATRVATGLDEEQVSNFAPLLGWAAIRHESQYSRLFRT